MPTKTRPYRQVARAAATEDLRRRILDAFRAAIGETVLPDVDVDIHADDFIGKQGQARLSVETYEGRKRNKVSAWLVPTPEPAA